MSAPGLRALAGRGTIHFMGVCGAGMTPLAELLLRGGATVTGCDLAGGEGPESLTRLGLVYHPGHDASHVAGATALVVTSAVPDDHPEVTAAHARRVPVIKRADALGQWVNDRRVVAVAGTHGKSTTTALATHVLVQAGLDPTGVVGAHVAHWDGNLRPGGSDTFVVEADEYDRSFLSLRPQVAVITNLEADHLDTYGDLNGVRDAFSSFVDRIEPDGALWVCADDSGAARAGVRGGARTRSYGRGAGAQLRAVGVRTSGAGSDFEVIEDGVSAGRFRVPAPGIHNVLNALAAVGVGRTMGAHWDDIRGGLEAFAGVGRRYEVLGRARDVEVVDDYAHHPTEVAATLATARRANPKARIVAVFQPHLFTRTRDFHQEFGRALGAADRIWVTDVYPAREPPLPGVTGEMVARAVPRPSARHVYHPEFSTLAAAVAADLSPGDVCVVMGAGSIEATAPEILARLGGGP